MTQVTLPIRVDPEKQLHVILVPHTATRHSSHVAPEFVSQTIMPFGSPIPTDVEGQEGSRPPPVAGGEAETSDRPSSTRSVSTPSTTTTPECVIDMTLPDEDTSYIVDMVSPTPPHQVPPDGSRPPPVVGGVADPKKESESPPSPPLN